MPESQPIVMSRISTHTIANADISTNTPSRVQTVDLAATINSAPPDHICDDPDLDFFRHSPWYRTLILFVIFDVISTSTSIVLLSSIPIGHLSLAAQVIPGTGVAGFNWLPLIQIFGLPTFVLNSLLLETMRIRGMHQTIVVAIQVCSFLKLAAVQQPFTQYFIPSVSLMLFSAICVHLLAYVLYWLWINCASFSHLFPSYRYRSIRPSH